MQLGNFFKIDENSVQSEGQVVFRYLPVYFFESDEVHYPVYMVIKPFSVVFCYNGLAPEGNDVDFLHNTIMELPLSMDRSVNDNLSHILDQIYRTSYTIHDKCEIELNETFRTTYSNLNVFNEKPEEISSNKPNGSKKILCRKVLLDFLFDFEHSTIFEASAHYGKAEVRLKENYLFSAIAAKAAYYCLRQLYLHDWDDDEEKLLYAHKLKNAEKKWLNVIRDIRTADYFNRKGWLKYIEEEYGDVMFPQSTSGATFNRSVWRQFLHNNEDRKNIKKDDDQDIVILSETARWYIRRYGISQGVKSLCQYFKPVYKIVAIVLFLSSFCWLVWKNSDSSLNHEFYTNLLIWPLKHWHALILYLLVSFLFLLLVLSVIFFILNKVSILLCGFAIIMPRLMMACASSWLIFVTTDEIWKTSYDIRFNDFSYFILPLIILFVALLIFMYFEINNIAPELTLRQIIWRLVCVLSVGLIISLFIGICFTNFTCEKMLIRSDYLAESYQRDIVKSGKFHFLKESNKSVDGNKSNVIPYCGINTKPDKPSAQEIFDKKLPSVYYHFFGTKVYLRYDIPLFYELKVKLFPGMLVFQAILALFIGIFFQLIFQDKPITEPL